MKFLGRKQRSNEYLKRLGINAWKFIPESRFLLLNIIRINDDVVENEENKDVNNGETDEIKNVDNYKDNKIIVVFFNAKSDVMIQTNYPFSNINNVPFDAIALNMSKNY